MKPEERQPGKCGIGGCPYDKVQLSNGVWVCPALYGSPMHFCDPVQFQEYEDTSPDIKEWVLIDDGKTKARARLEEYAGCSLEQYLLETRSNSCV